MQFNQEFSIWCSEFDACCNTIGVKELWETITQSVVLFRYPKMHLVGHISHTVQPMNSGYNLTKDISEQQHICDITETYQLSNKVNYIRLMLKHNDLYTSLHYMEEVLSHFALQGWYDINSAILINLLSATDKQQTSCRSQLLCLQHCQDKPFFCHAPQQVYYLRETLVCSDCRSIKLTSLRDALVDFWIRHYRERFCTQIKEDWSSDLITMYSLTDD